VLEKLPGRYDASGLLPCLSTIAPCGSENFLDRLADLKQRRYPGGRFQMQFSLHTTDPSVRDRLMPLPKWSFSRIAEYGNGFFSPGDRRIALNFALMQHVPVDPKIVAEYFDPRLFLIKITPMNPTYAAVHHGLSSVSADLLDSGTLALAGELRSLGFEVIVSVGETAEDRIGSNCGQYVTRHLASKAALGTAYTESIQIDTRQPGTDRATSQR
jgi:23S rRNA (adenine2503-C2)-methyltransferase